MTYAEGRKPAELFQAANCLKCGRVIAAGAVNWVHIKMGVYRGQKQHRNCNESDDWLGWLPPQLANKPYSWNPTVNNPNEKTAAEKALEVEKQVEWFRQYVQKPNGNIPQTPQAPEPMNPVIKNVEQVSAPSEPKPSKELENQIQELSQKVTLLEHSNSVLNNQVQLVGRKHSSLEDSYLDLLEKLEKLEANQPKTLTIEIKQASTVVKTNTIQNPHPKFETLMKLARKRKWAFLTGPAGSFKSTAARQVAESLSLEFYYISLNRQSTPTTLIGFIDASGKYQTTSFRQAYEFGGVFCIDEMDNASGNLLTSLNSALANGRMSFPDTTVPVKIHPDFICIATGNTTGRGANAMHNERQKLDDATLDRFAIIDWPYDEQTERAIALRINPNCSSWIDHVQQCRKRAKDLNLKHTISPRATFDGASLIEDFTFEELTEMLILRGCDVDTAKKITHRS